MAIWLITSHSESLASTTLPKDLKLTQRPAWFMHLCVRRAARTQSFTAPYGIHHWVSEKHLKRYDVEMTFHLNRRDLSVTERMNHLFASAEVPMPYRELIA